MSKKRLLIDLEETTHNKIKTQAEKEHRTTKNMIETILDKETKKKKYAKN